MALEKIRPYQMTQADSVSEEAFIAVDDGDTVEAATVKLVRRPPSMTKAERNALASPGNGDIIYQTDNTPGFRFYQEGAWGKITLTADP